MEEYNNFDRLARTALARFAVNVGTFYGRRETCRDSSTARFYVSVNGQGLPPEGFTAGREKAAEAIAAVVSRLKRHRADAAASRDAAARARRQPESSTLNDTAPCQPGN